MKPRTSNNARRSARAGGVANASLVSPNMLIERWPIDRPKDYPKNARKWSGQAIEKVASSIDEFGWRQPVVVDANDVIVIGHLRRAAGRFLGLTEVPVHVAKDLTPAQIRGLRLADNRTNQEASWDEELLAVELAELNELDFDLGLTGFDVHELDSLLRDPMDDEKANEAPPLPVVATTRPGDLWLCGDHRALCGDATSAQDVARLLGDHKPFLMVTDPPYGVELDMEWRDRAGHNEMGPAAKSYMKHRTEGHTATTISGDTKADWSDAFALVPTLDVAYVWHATSHLVEVAVGLDRIGFHVRQQLIWNKTAAAMSRQAYHWKHEPCWYAVRRGKTAHWLGSRDQSTIWDAASPKMIMGGSTEVKENHPTQKPIELMRRPILNHTKRGGLVYDPFLGSGTTLAAAEVTERTCLGLELDPKYIDVVVQRWQSLTHKTATLDGDGRTFEQIKAERVGIAA
jgi:DNA modification methylase